MNLAEAISKRKGLREDFSKVGNRIMMEAVSITYMSGEEPKEIPDKIKPLLDEQKAIAEQLIELDGKIDKANVSSGNMVRINKVHYLKQLASSLTGLGPIPDDHRFWSTETRMVDAKVGSVRILSYTKPTVDKKMVDQRLAEIKNQLRQLNLEIDVANINTQIE